MTTDTRLDRQLTEVLEELYLGHVPDYEAEILQTAVAHRQRRAWTFLRWWVPIPELSGARLAVPRLPWRSLALALVLLALLLAAVLVAGSRQTKVPSPFGVARNGVVAYSIYGDIHSTDVVSGITTPLVLGPALDSRPVFSRDGSRLAFLRASATGSAFDLMVAGADGSGVRAIAGSPIKGMDDGHDFDFEWAGDDRSLIVYVEPRILRVDAVGSAPPVVLTDDAVPTGRLGPNGLILYQPASISDAAVWAIGIDGAPARELLRRSAAESGGDLHRARYSPDGSMIAFERTLLPDEDGQLRIFVARADGTGARRLTDATGIGVETDFSWSPDGRFIAFNRWVPLDPAQPGGEWEPLPIGVAAVGPGTAGTPVLPTGPSLGAQGADFEWSPDGSALIAIPTKPTMASRLNKPMVIDVATGEPRALEVTTNERTNWQRVTP